MDDVDRRILLEMEDGIPLTREPFKDIAGKVGMTEEEIIGRISSLQKEGVIRRFGATVKPNDVGLLANAMVAWKVPRNRVQEIGAFLSKSSEVTHCYERETIPGMWEYNLYTVMHAVERETIKRQAEILADAVSINDYIILFSKRELKKTSTIAMLRRS